MTIPPIKSRFPHPSQSQADGLLAVGGLLHPDWLLDAYRNGIFPWPMSDECEEQDSEESFPMLWWSPDPRAILPLDGLHVSKRLLRTLRSNKYEVTINRAFDQVIRGCAYGPGREQGTWITDEMIEAYCRMHHLGHAHCVEAWLDGQLAGGVYGLAIGGLFAAESMFRYERDASKVALAYLVEHLKQRGYELLDIQEITPHTKRLGAVEICREDYLSQLQDVVDLPISFGAEFEEPIPW